MAFGRDNNHLAIGKVIVYRMFNRAKPRTVSFEYLHWYLFVFLLPALLLISLFVAWDESGASPAGDAAFRAMLDPDELAWLDRHSTIRANGPRAFPPFSFFEKDGAAMGVAHDYLRLIASKVGLEIDVQPEMPWPEVLESIKEKNTDMLSVCGHSPEREDYLLFSEPYLSFPSVIISRRESSFVGGLADLHGMKVALIKNSTTVEFLKKHNIQIIPYIVSTPLDALKSVSTGSADAFIDNLASATWLIEKHGIANLKVAAPTQHENYNLYMAVRKDWPELLAIVNKALGSITAEEHAAIRNRWLSVRVEHAVRIWDILKWLLLISIPVITLILVVVIWNRRLQLEIIEHKRARQGLQHSEAKYRQLFEASPISLWEQDFSEVKKRLDQIARQTQEDLRTWLLERPELVWELVGQVKVLDVNQSSLRLYRATSKQDLLAGITRILARESHRDFTNVLLAMAADARSLSGERQHLTLDGGNLTVKFYWSVMPGCEHDYSRVLVCIVDITVLKQAEEKLRESKKRLVNAQRIARLGDYVWNIPSGEFTWSEALYDLLHYDKSEVFDLAKIQSQVHHPDDLERISQWTKSCIRSNRNELVPLESRVFRSDGETRLVRNTGIIQRKDGKPFRVLGTIQDITEYKQAEENLHQLQKSESLSCMAGAIAHNFNNMLQAIMGNLEILALDVLQPEQVAPCLNHAVTASRKAAELSTLMLTFLGQSTGRQLLLNLPELVQQSLPMLQAAIPRQIELKTNLNSTVPAILGDVDQIRQVLMNLLTNAWESIGEQPGFVYLSVSNTLPADIPGSHRFPVDWRPAHASYVCLEVRDTGPEIAMEHMGKLFDPFFSTKFTGRGMGLAVVLGVVKSHGGCVSVQSIPNRGNTFRICFPASEIEIAQPSGSPRQAMEGRWNGGILLVEDEAMVREVTRKMLASIGFTVLTAEDGVEALEVFKQHQDDIRLVLCDVSMPRKDGWQTLIELRRIKPAIPVILASGRDENQVMRENQPEQPQTFLHKPFQLQELRNAVNKALDT